MADFNLNSFVVDHVLRGVMTNAKDGSYMWSVSEMTDPSLSVTTETADAVDALGSVIASFDRAKNAEFTANSSIFDLDLYAAQNGKEKEVATTTKKITTPAFETLEVKAGETTVKLAHTPNAEITTIYTLNGDDTLGVPYTAGTAASATAFVYDNTTATITVPTGFVGNLFVMYEYEAEQAVQVVGDGINFPKAGKFVMEVLGSDLCDTSTKIHAYIVFPNAKLDANVDISFTTDGNHPFTIRALQSYCDGEKVLFKIIIPKED